ncbi:hypothetical protein Aperf_G00000055609 [Anoplocephala perfoliata]
MDKCTVFHNSEPVSHAEVILSADQPPFSPPSMNCNDAKETTETAQLVKEIPLISSATNLPVLSDRLLASPSTSGLVDLGSSKVNEIITAPLENLQVSSAVVEVAHGAIPASCDSAQSPMVIDPNEEDSSDEAGGITIAPPRGTQRIPTPPQPTSSSPGPSHSPFIGLSPPEWAADASSSVCVSCGARFTVLRRRHHCRTCGRLLCASCTPHRVPLPSTFINRISPSSQEENLLRLVAGSVSTLNSEEKLQRVCTQCFRNVFGGVIGTTLQPMEDSPRNIVSSAPARPQVPPAEIEAPGAMVPPANTLQRRRIPSSFAVQRLKDECLIPSTDSSASTSNSVWPPLVVSTSPELVLETDVSNDRVSELLSSASGAVTFAITRNLHVNVSVTADGQVWRFLSHGLYTVGQEEVCLLLRRRTAEALPPIDSLWHYLLLYQLAFSQNRGDGRTRQTRTSSSSSFSFPFDDGSLLLLPNPGKSQLQNDYQQQETGSSWFDGTCCGFLYIHANSCRNALLSSLTLLPSPPFLFAISLRSPNEASIASRHPLRLLLALNRVSNGYNLPLISDRDRQPLFASDGIAGPSILSLSDGVGMYLLQIPEVNILATGLGNASDELKLQLLLRRVSHKYLRRSLHHVGRENSLLLGLAGDFCSNADCHLVIADSTAGLVTELTPSVVPDASKMAVEAGRSSSLSIVEDGFVAQLTREQFKALISHIRSASPLQLRIETAQSPPDSLLSLLPSQTSPSNQGALITLDWIDEPPSMHPTSLHYSCIDGRPVEPRCTFSVPREHQLRHWLIRLNLSDPDAFNDPTLSLGPRRIAWTRLHSLDPRPVYAVDNRSGEVLDFFAVFNAVAATFINALFPHSLLLRKANHRSISLRIILQPPNTFNFFIGSNSSFLANPSNRRSANGLVPCTESCDWWKVIDASNSQEGVWTPPGPLILEPAYIDGLDSALIPLLDGLVHNISCSWFFDATVEQPLSSVGEGDELTAPGLVLEFDFDILD